MGNRICPCGSEAVNRKGPPRCTACRIERVRLTQQRFRDKSRGSYLRGFDEPTCLWCGADNQPRAYEVLSPKRFCSHACGTHFRAEQEKYRVAVERRCPCGAVPVNRTGVPNCAACRSASKQRQARARNLRPYGLQIADYERMLADQDGQCAICDRTDPGHGHIVFVVDHCHETGRIRGLLCRNCNSAIGLLGDDPKMIRRAATYIERNRG